MKQHHQLFNMLEQCLRASNRKSLFQQLAKNLALSLRGLRIQTHEQTKQVKKK